jgi:Tfp pilus assembly protein PilF
LHASHKIPIIFFQIVGRMQKIKVPSTVFLFILLFCSSFSFGEVSEEVKGQIKYGVRAAKDDHWDEAIYRWRKALQLDPNNLMAHNNLAVAYEQLGEYELALEEYQIAYRLDSQNQNVKNNLDRFRDFYRKYQRQKE